MEKIKLNILTPIPFWHPGTQELIDGLKQRNFEVVALDIWSFNYYDEDQKITNLVPNFFRGRLERIYKRVFRKGIIKRYIKKDQIVDIQWCGHYYSKYMDSIKRRKVKIVSSLFGSDFYRSTDAQHALQTKIYNYANTIVIGPNMHADFTKVYPQFENKIRYCHFGSKRLDLVMQLRKDKRKATLREKYQIPSDKICVAIGYSANPLQQHFLILDAIERLQNEDKERLYLLLPMTYGDLDNYVDQVINKLKALKVDYICFCKQNSKFAGWLTDEEISEIRIITDVTVNVQTTDALSSSIKEAFAADNILLVGDWLPYDIYKNMNLFFIRSDANSIFYNLQQIIKDYEDLRIRTSNNAEIIYNFASWERILPLFIKNYKELLK